jgi:hypothetical protein
VEEALPSFGLEAVREAEEAEMEEAEEGKEEAPLVQVHPMMEAMALGPMASAVPGQMCPMPVGQLAVDQLAAAADQCHGPMHQYCEGHSGLALQPHSPDGPGDDGF